MHYIMTAWWNVNSFIVWTMWGHCVNICGFLRDYNIFLIINLTHTKSRIPSIVTYLFKCLIFVFFSNRSTSHRLSSKGYPRLRRSLRHHRCARGICRNSPQLRSYKRRGNHGSFILNEGVKFWPDRKDFAKLTPRQSQSSSPSAIEVCKHNNVFNPNIISLECIVGYRNCPLVYFIHSLLSCSVQ